jgi:hypothetical protein
MSPETQCCGQNQTSPGTLNHKSSDRVNRPKEEYKVSCEEIIHRIVELGIYPKWWNRLIVLAVDDLDVKDYRYELHVAEPVVKNITIPLLIILTKMEKSRISLKA